MKKNPTFQKSFLVIILFFVLSTTKTFSQTILEAGDYNLCIKNMHQVSCSEMQFDIYLQWDNPSKSNLFNFFQGGLDFDYNALANGGVISAQFLPGSADAGVPVAAKNPNWNLNQNSKQIRFLAAIVTPAANSAPVPPAPGWKLGTLRLFNTVPFALFVNPNFVWSYIVASNKTQTKEGFYLNGSSTAVGFVDQSPFPNHCPTPGPILGNPCPIANAGGPYTSCGDVHLIGSASFYTTATWTSNGTGTFDPNANELNAIYHPSSADLLNGVSLTLTASQGGICGGPGGCSPTVSSVLINFTSTNDNNGCTIDGCNQISGIPFHNPINVDDGNPCTTDGCNSSTGIFNTPVDPSDGNLCTNDFCDSSTGNIIHVPINYDDGNACTNDVCNSIIGPDHILINYDDGNVCTTDGCDPATGEFHNPVDPSDGNACTSDGCDPVTGVYHIPADPTDFIDCTIDACNTLTGEYTHVSNPPTISVTSSEIQCYGLSACVTVTATGGLPPYLQTGEFCGYPAGTYLFSVIDSHGCVDDSTITIDQPSKLILSVITSPSNGSDGTATAVVNGGTLPYSYLWSAGGQTTNPSTGLAPGNYCVIVTDDNGCTTTECFTIGPACQLTPPGPISGPVGVCKKQSGIVYCVNQNQYATSYAWVLPIGATAIGTSNGPCITLKFSSKFKGGFICAKAITPCGITDNSCLSISLITKKPSTPGIISGPSSLCPNETATYSIASVSNASSYTWSKGGNIQILSGQGTTSIVVKALSNWNGGSVKVKAVNCFDHSGDRNKNIAKTQGCKITQRNISIAEPTPSNETMTSLNVYPNPTSGKITVSFNTDRNETYLLKILDVIGKSLLSENIQSFIGYNTKEINLKNLSKGIYLVSLQKENGNVMTIRLIFNGD